ncbi:hypothetical protein BDZ91DRAFT_266022 [Kalaharituber pfeilii]|nr:hypothetical protein BDZ91DRAFT_266022 [Kalaharituber pfeilii]
MLPKADRLRLLQHAQRPPCLQIHHRHHARPMWSAIPVGFGIRSRQIGYANERNWDGLKGGWRYLTTAPPSANPDTTRFSKPSSAPTTSGNDFTATSANDTTAFSSTSIHAPTPSILKLDEAKHRLIASLDTLSHLRAANTSLVSLAQRSLEQRGAPVRIAVLGTAPAAGEAAADDIREAMCAPARLLRVLLADTEHPVSTWEEELLNWCGREETQGLLIRFSPIYIPLRTVPGSPLATLSVPSLFLEIYNLEFLLTLLPAAEPTEEDIHVPTLIASVPSSNLSSKTKGPHRSSGMVMRYPVHKTIIFSKGLEEMFVAAGTLAKISWPETAVSVAWVPGMERGVSREGLKGQRIKMVDLEGIEERLEVCRSGVNGEWMERDSIGGTGIEELKRWVTSGFVRRERVWERVHPATKTLIEVILKRAAAAPISHSSSTLPSAAGTSPSRRSSTAPITDEDTSTESPSKRATPPRPADNLQSLTEAMNAFATFAHQDLKNSLDAAFNSRYWTHRLAWYRVPFQLDNVGYLAAAALAGHYLPDTERAVWMLAGRMWGGGFRDFADTTGSTDPGGISTTSISAAGIPTANPATTNTTADSTISPIPTKPPTTPVDHELTHLISSADVTPTSGPTSHGLDPNHPTFPPVFPTSYTHITTHLLPSLHSSATTYVLTSTSFFLTSLFTTSLLYMSDFSLYASGSASAAGAVAAMWHFAEEERGEECEGGWYGADGSR